VAAEAPDEPAVWGVILAAGLSTRFPGGRAKQLLDFGDEPMVRWTARNALASGLAGVIAVVGHRAAEVRAALAGLPVEIAENPDFAEGLSTSVRAGLARVPVDAAAALFLPADQPLAGPELLDRLIAAWRETGGPIVEPFFAGRRGSPVVLDRSLFAELAALTGDVGGRAVIARHPERVIRVPLDNGTPLLDADSEEAYRRLLAAAASSTPG
jgi:molybdenum cofactor cytidylyltransferase